MCVLAIWLGQDPTNFLVVGANRDESYARRSARPAEVEPGIVAGRDLEKGGTWLGINRTGLFVAVTNRFAPAVPPDAYSRGQLALEALRCGSLAELERLVEQRVGEHRFAGFNLVAMDRGDGVSLHYDGTLRPVRFGSGVHVISSDSDLNAPHMPEKRALDRFAAGHPGTPDEVALRTFLASHDGARPVCKHGNHFGTVSSTILTVSAAGPRMVHAEGPPCRTPFEGV